MDAKASRMHEDEHGDRLRALGSRVLPGVAAAPARDSDDRTLEQPPALEKPFRGSRNSLHGWVVRGGIRNVFADSGRLSGPGR
jgi:hypothetical protein